MATYSSNTTIKVSAAISATSNASSGTLYTVPANCYAIITSVGASVFGGSGGTSATVSITGAVLVTDSGTAAAEARAFYVGGIYLGPGHSVSYTTSSAGGTRYGFAYGVLFINTP
jgi:hypothetical protein